MLSSFNDCLLGGRQLKLKGTKPQTLGYLNADSPFDRDGWYNTKDIVEENAGYYKVTSRTSDVINVEGLKFMASDVKRLALECKHVALAKAEAKPKSISSHHIELTVQPAMDHDLDRVGPKAPFSDQLPTHMVPKRLSVSSVRIGHRFEKG